MDLSEKRVDLPSGGTAWVARVASHGQAKTLRLARFRLERFRSAGRDEEGAPTRIWRTGLSEAEEQERDHLVLDESDLYIRTFTTRWEGIRSPTGDDLTFPDDIERMAEPDADALFEAILSGQAGADPNVGPPPSPSSSPAESSPTTPNSGTI
jgi:hypothetical protein